MILLGRIAGELRGEPIGRLIALAIFDAWERGEQPVIDCVKVDRLDEDLLNGLEREFFAQANARDYDVMTKARQLPIKLVGAKPGIQNGIARSLYRGRPMLEPFEFPSTAPTSRYIDAHTEFLAWEPKPEPEPMAR